MSDKQTINIMAKDFLMTNVFEDCYMFEYFEQKTKKIKNEEEEETWFYNHIVNVRCKDIIKFDDRLEDIELIIEDIKNNGNKYTLFFANHGIRNYEKEETKEVYRILYAVDTEEHAPSYIPDSDGIECQALVQYTEIIPISFYKIEL